MKPKLIEVNTDRAPKAIGPYSQGVIAGDYLYVSGQIPIDPRTGELVEGDIGLQTNQVLDNIEKILNASNLDLDGVVKVEVYLKDIGDFQAMNEVYAERFKSDPKPARQAMEVARLPKDALIEMSCIAYLSR